MQKINVLMTTLVMGCCGVAAYGQGEPFQGNHEQEARTKPLQCIPANNLNLEDAGFLSNISEDQFNGIIEAAYRLYVPFAQQRNERLQINNLWNDSTVNANCTRNNGVVTVNMYGGLARRPEVTPEGFALVLCHELGHAYGGAPYLYPQAQIAAEGQADYYGEQGCLRALLYYVYDSNLAPDYYVQTRCNGNSICVRQMQAGQSLSALLATISQQYVPNYQTPDRTVTPQTLLGYPRTIQCRMDTYHNAIFGLARPACWFRN